MSDSPFKNFDPETFLNDGNYEFEKLTSEFGSGVTKLIAKSIINCGRWVQQSEPNEWGEVDALIPFGNAKLRKLLLQAEELARIGNQIPLSGAYSGYTEIDSFLERAVEAYISDVEGEITQDLLIKNLVGICCLRRVDIAITQLKKEGFTKDSTNSLMEAYSIFCNIRNANLSSLEYKQTLHKIAEPRIKGANALHNKPNGSRAKRAKIQEIWVSGKYDNKDLCAEQECAALNMSYSTARKALRNLPKPS